MKSDLSFNRKFDAGIVNDNHLISLQSVEKSYCVMILCDDTITLHPFSQRPFFSHFEALPHKMSVHSTVEEG